MSLYCRQGGPNAELSQEFLRQSLYQALDQLGDRRRVLAVPPDFTRFPSQAGPLTQYAYTYYGDRLGCVLPALGTHTPMPPATLTRMFGDIPHSLFACTTGAPTWSPWASCRQASSRSSQTACSITLGRPR